MEANEGSAFYLPSGLTDEEDDSGLLSASSAAADVSSDAGGRTVASASNSGVFNSMWSSSSAPPPLYDPQWGSYSPPQTPPQSGSQSASLAHPQLSASWDLNPTAWPSSASTSASAWGPVTSAPFQPRKHQSPPKYDPSSSKFGMRSLSPPPSKSHASSPSSISPSNRTASAAQTAQTINQWFSADYAVVRQPDSKLSRLYSNSSPRSKPPAARPPATRPDYSDWDRVTANTSTSTSPSNSAVGDPQSVMSMAMPSTLTASPFQPVATASQPSRESKKAKVSNQTIPGLNVEKKSRPNRRKNKERARAREAAQATVTNDSTAHPDPVVTRPKHDPNDDMVILASKRIEESRERWASQLAAAARESKNENQVLRSRAKTTASLPQGTGTQDPGTGTSKVNRRRGRARGTQAVQSTQGKHARGGTDLLKSSPKDSTGKSWTRPTPSRQIVQDAIDQAQTRVLLLVTTLVTLVTASMGMVFDFIRAVVSVVRRLHRHALSCLLSDSQVAFCIVFTYCFPFIEYVCSLVFPPWASRCLWYGFLVQNGFLSNGGDLSEILLLVLFLLDGLTYSTTITDLNGSERLILGYFLAAARLGAHRKRLCLLSGSAQVAVRLCLGPGAASQWIIGLLSSATLPVPPLLFQDSDSDRSAICIVIGAGETTHPSK